MNKIYKVIWSKTRNCYVAVAEFVKRNGKGGSVLNRRHIAAALAAVAIFAAPAGVQAASTGGELIEGGNVYVGFDAGTHTARTSNNVVIYESDMSGVNAAAGGVSIANYNPGASVKDNSLTINTDSGTNELFRAYGGVSLSAGNATATGNKVIIYDGTVNDSVYGGHSDSNSGTATASGNEVTISGGKVGWVYGGEAVVRYGGYSSAVTNNSVTINDGEFGDGATVYGGRARTYSKSGTATATGNTVTIGEKFKGSVGPLYGGYSKSKSGTATATGNEVTVKGGTTNSVVGGYSFGDAVANKVIISGGSIENDAKVYGGRSESNSGNATDNMVTIGENFEGTVAELYGGSSNNGNATGNRVDIAGGSLGGAYGGFSEKGSAAGNQVDITGGTFGGVFGGFSDSGDATGNRVNITGSKVGAVFGGFSNKVVKYNTVIIGGGTFEEGVYGGFSQPGVAEKNAVTISDGTFENPIQVFGGYSQTKATDNAVNLTGTTTGLDMAELQGYPGGADFNVSHSGNELHIGAQRPTIKTALPRSPKGAGRGWTPAANTPIQWLR